MNHKDLLIIIASLCGLSIIYFGYYNMQGTGKETSFSMHQEQQNVKIQSQCCNMFGECFDCNCCQDGMCMLVNAPGAACNLNCECDTNSCVDDICSNAQPDGSSCEQSYECASMNCVNGLCASS